LLSGIHISHGVVYMHVVKDIQKLLGLYRLKTGSLPFGDFTGPFVQEWPNPFRLFYNYLIALKLNINAARRMISLVRSRFSEFNFEMNASRRSAL
jgi:hypothetical protein